MGNSIVSDIYMYYDSNEIMGILPHIYTSIWCLDEIMILPDENRGKLFLPESLDRHPRLHPLPPVSPIVFPSMPALAFPAQTPQPPSPS
jgi:hypothetical protein